MLGCNDERPQKLDTLSGGLYKGALQHSNWRIRREACLTLTGAAAASCLEQLVFAHSRDEEPGDFSNDVVIKPFLLKSSASFLNSSGT